MKWFLQVGELLYCNNRGMTSCCFVNEKCGGNWDTINDEMTQKAVDFLQNPKVFVTDLVKKAGYDTCHRTEEYDADQCHQDCQEQEKSDFARNCTKDGGLYKCCIRWIYLSILMLLHHFFFRRDKVFCHECRFCCTLSVCTDKQGKSYYRDSLDKPLNGSKNKVFIII